MKKYKIQNRSQKTSHSSVPFTQKYSSWQMNRGILYNVLYTLLFLKAYTSVAKFLVPDWGI